MNLRATEGTRASLFSRGFEKPDADDLTRICMADDFEFEMMGRLPGVAPVRGKDALSEVDAGDAEGDVSQRA